MGANGQQNFTEVGNQKDTWTTKKIELVAQRAN